MLGSLSDYTGGADGTLPIVEEQLRIDRRSVETDRMRVRTVTETVPVVHDERIERGELDVERVAVERPVDAAPEPYEEDGVLVIALVEERLVIEKRLFVVEELRIRRRSEARTITIEDKLRRQRAVVERDRPAD